ncbi:GIY-YIG nuclease family protein [Bacillus sp. V33-4]|uniref:GIY-YIG nuclease family protein n=1 Tax=Bacillus sp. V33-4 TaxID=2054169 RepID=UPI000C77D9C2|nr:GIY-YIG nuclease family protein [Bacillus sp. V33-4]PLR82744.1 DUF123 domain-containing protein [Bacillus sp. V33-4]
MEDSINQLHTLYAVYLKVEQEGTIHIGRLGRFYFQEGTYIYVGSAKRNIASRISRHLKVDKKKRWHFDYLIPLGKVIKIITYEATIGECALVEKLRKETAGMYPVKGFGSSDCRCFSHLIYCPSPLDFR